MLTEKELKICENCGADWITRDKISLEDDEIFLWKGTKPIYQKQKRYVLNEGTEIIGTLNATIFPSIKPGDCISLLKN